MTPQEFLESKGIDSHTIVAYHFKNNEGDGINIDVEALMLQYARVRSNQEKIIKEIDES